MHSNFNLLLLFVCLFVCMKLRLLFHGTIHWKAEEMRLILPSTFNPYNMVEYLELVMTELDVQLLTNSECLFIYILVCILCIVYVSQYYELKNEAGTCLHQLATEFGYARTSHFSMI